MKIKFEKKYPPDVRWSVIVLDFITYLRKKHFEYLSVRDVAYRLMTSCAVDNWMQYDKEGRFTAHFAKLIFREHRMQALANYMEDREWTLQERLGGYMGPGIMPPFSKEGDGEELTWCVDLGTEQESEG